MKRTSYLSVKRALDMQQELPHGWWLERHCRELVKEYVREARIPTEPSVTVDWSFNTPVTIRVCPCYKGHNLPFMTRTLKIADFVSAWNDNLPEGSVWRFSCDWALDARMHIGFTRFVQRSVAHYWQHG